MRTFPAPAPTPAVDVDAIARAAVAQDRRRCLDAAITAELRRAGLPGDYASSPTWRRVYHDVVSAALALRASKPRVPTPASIRGTGAARAAEARRALLALSARVLWRRYAEGQSQAQIALEIGVCTRSVHVRSAKLGFVLTRYGVTRGPCTDCGTVLAVRELREHVCAECRAALIPIFDQREAD